MPSLVNGLGGPAGFGEGVLGPNDDDSTPEIGLDSIFPDGLNFFGTVFHSIFVNNNGNLTFGNSTDQFDPSEIGTGLDFPIIAAFWTDIDTRGSEQSTSPGGTSTGSNLVYYDLDLTTHTFTATWDDVDYYSHQTGHPLAFQIQLIAVGSGNFDIAFIYESIVSDSDDYYIGNARAGYSPGVDDQGHLLPGSFEVSGSPGRLVDIDTNPGNTAAGTPGYYLFHVVGGQVSGGTGAPPQPARPVTFDLGGLEPHREGDVGATPFMAIISRAGSDLSGSSVVHWEVQAPDPTDLVAGQDLSGDVVFGPGQTTATVQVDVQGDRIFESDDWFQFRVTSATHGDMTWNPGLVGTAIIRNDDSPIAFSGPQIRPEGAAGPSPFDFTVVRTGDPATALTVNWSLEFSSANAQDLAPGQALTGVLTFAPGASQGLITINVAGDILPELDETFTLRLTSAVSNGSTTLLNNVTATGTILDDDIRQTLLVSSPNTTVLPEGDTGQTTFSFNLMRIGDLSGAAQIPYAISLPAVGATSFGEILTPLSGMVSFAAGSDHALLTVLISADATPEENEAFLVTLGGGDFNTLIVNGVILNDDKLAVAPGSPSVALPDANVSAFMSHLSGGSLWSDAGAI
ncbi:MAG: hypothetical protein JWQ29_2896 [Phenylobacterium sp.]|nr:hypothetical protein [Phenylobacterium sp.]